MKTEDEETILEQAEPITADEQESVSAEGATLIPEDENEVVVTIGEEKPVEDEATKAPEWVKELRKAHRELARENKELKAKLTTAPNPVVQLGKKPTLEDFDYDAEKFEEALTGWFEKKRQTDQAEERKQDEAKKQNQSWQDELGNYGKLRAALKVKDFAEAEADAQSVLSEVQQAIIVHVADNPAQVVYGLGKDMDQAKKLAAIADPTRFASAVTKLEATLKVTPKKPSTQPERTLTSAGHISGTVDSTEERLTEKANKTGDRSELLAYRTQKRKTT